MRSWKARLEAVRLQVWLRNDWNFVTEGLGNINLFDGNKIALNGETLIPWASRALTGSWEAWQVLVLPMVLPGTRN